MMRAAMVLEGSWCHLSSVCNISLVGAASFYFEATCKVPEKKNLLVDYVCGISNCLSLSEYYNCSSLGYNVLFILIGRNGLWFCTTLWYTLLRACYGEVIKHDWSLRVVLI